MKRESEGQFGAALRSLDVELPIEVYKPPDDARNMKPCDFMVWFRRSTMAEHVEPVWFEVKDTSSVGRFPFSEIRPSQHAGIRAAHRIGIPYYLAVYWRRDRTWTISNAHRVVEWRDETPPIPAKSIPRVLLASRFGVDSSPGQLGITLRAVLLGEVD